MITIEQALEADKQFKWCHELKNSEAFAEVVLKEIARRRDEACAAGTDVHRSPAERAEHHRAFHLANELLSIVDMKLEEAKGTLQQWAEQQGEKFSGIPDDKNV